jgi:hypothetical protein
MLIAEVRVNGAKSGHAEASVLGPNPSVVEFNVFLEGQFSTGKEIEHFPCQALEGRVSDISQREGYSWHLNSNATPGI